VLYTPYIDFWENTRFRIPNTLVRRKNTKLTTTEIWLHLTIGSMVFAWTNMKEEPDGFWADASDTGFVRSPVFFIREPNPPEDAVCGWGVGESVVFCCVVMMFLFIIGFVGVGVLFCVVCFVVGVGVLFPGGCVETGVAVACGFVVGVAVVFGDCVIVAVGFGAVVAVGCGVDVGADVGVFVGVLLHTAPTSVGSRYCAALDVWFPGMTLVTSDPQAWP
jgi:hypothetical protein